MSKKKKHKKPPEMPHWFWYGILDGCWFCKNTNGCNNCKAIREFRKEFFDKKYKGKKYEKRSLFDDE